MLFNSIDFALYLPIVLCAYYTLARRAQNVWLLAASYTFYAWWDWRFLSLILISTITDYYLAQRIHRAKPDKERKLLLSVSVATNLGLLGTFKYFNFFVDSFIRLGASVGLDFDTPALRLLPPVGISFYTFQTLSYTIDVYRRKVEPERDFVTFALFVSYFPQLVAGPIERARRLLPQLHARRQVTLDTLSIGLLLIWIGLFKKVVVADAAGVRVDEIFAAPDSHSGWTLWKGAILFSVQIYGDFSGYSNMARGISFLLGIQLVENFKTPFFSQNVSEFWRRWHISLSEWLRDYLYISLGGNRKGSLQTYRNLMATMILGGLWHGAAWTFIVWGFLHGSYLVIHRLWRRTVESLPLPLAPTFITWPLSVGLTFVAVIVAFVVFRAASITDAWHYLSGMFTLRGDFQLSDLATPGALILLLLPLEILQYRNRDDVLALRKLPLVPKSVAYTVLAVSVLLATNNEIPFIYFQF